MNPSPDLYSDERDHDRAERQSFRAQNEERCPACNCRKIDCDCPSVWGWYGILIIALVLVAMGLGVLGGR